LHEGDQHGIISRRTRHPRRGEGVDPAVRGVRRRSVARRLQAERIEEFVTLQFYASPGSIEAGAILTFSDRERIMEHINMISGWEEFERFVGTVRPTDVRMYGRLSAEAERWVRNLDVVSKTFEDHIAGFVRWGQA
jgi:hypothetical protein